MAIFSNQATLSYNNSITNSNVVTGELVEAITAAKTAVDASYEADGTITYVISIVNSGENDFSDLAITDDLGAYEFNGETLVPLNYVQGSVRYFLNGILQTAPDVTPDPTLEISGINVPAGGNALIIYDAAVNQFAPLGEGASITNTANVSGLTCTLSTTTVSETVPANGSVRLTITKTVDPETVTECDTLTYTFIIQNSGSSPATVDDNVAVTDTFDPILDITEVTFNGTPWTQPTFYTYNETTGEFSTVVGRITVPAATYSQNPETGEWTVIPGVSVLTVTGNV